MSVIKIAGKSPTDTVKSVNVSANGELMTQKKWVNGVVQLFDSKVPESGKTSISERINISDVGAVSLRVSNSLNVPITIGLYSDWFSHDYQIRDADGALIRKTIGAKVENVMITPDDMPQLMWLRTLRVYFTTPSTEETITGTVNMWAVTKG